MAVPSGVLLVGCGHGGGGSGDDERVAVVDFTGLLGEVEECGVVHFD